MLPFRRQQIVRADGYPRGAAMVPVRRILWVACLLAATPAGAQSPVAHPPTRQASSPSSGAAPDFDINAVVPDTFRIIAVRLPEGQAPKIDGRMDDEVWHLAEAAGDFVQREPRFGARITERTEFRILYDEKWIYFGIWAYDSDPDGIIASELKRDAGLKKGDQVKVVIDTFHDHRNNFFLATNPLGARKDSYDVDNGRIVNYEWNGVWECKTSRDRSGWYVEIAIPLSQLRFKASPAETVWGLNVCRIIARKQEEAYWVPYPREWGTFGISRLAGAGHIAGIKGLRDPRRLELTPFALPRITRDASSSAADASFKYGADARVGLSSEVTADFTYKTDFAQVEADQEVVNTSRFSLFFPEKRPFLAESAGIFDFGRAGGNNTLGGESAEASPGLLAVFYSRRIGLDEGREVPVLGGGKVTGRAGPYAFGVMDIVTDRRTGPDGAVSRANYSVARVKRNVLSQSVVGAVLLGRQGGPGAAYNRTIGVDAGLLLGRATTVTGILAKTFSPDVSGQDLAGALDVAWKTDRFNSGLTYLDVGERFNAEMGYIPRVDTRNLAGRAAWTPRPKWRGVRQLTFQGDVKYYENHRGQPDTRTQKASFRLDRQDSANFQAAVSRDYDFVPYNWAISPGRVVPIGAYTWETISASYSTNSTKRLYASASTDLGGYYGGTKRSYRVTLNALPLVRLLVEGNYTLNHITLPATSSYDTNTVNLRVSYGFSPELFVKGFLQYNDERHLASFNFLLSHQYRPGSDFYVVLNQGWDVDVPAPTWPRARNWSLAVKTTYWLSR